MKTGMYLKLQLKRAFKIYPTVLWVTVVTFLCVALAAAAVLHGHFGDSDQKLIRIGVVGDTKDTFMGIGIEALESMDTLRFYVDFIEMDEAQAMRDLKRQKIHGYIQLPPGFVNGIVSGENIPARYVTLKSSDGVGGVLADEVFKVISHMVVETQNGIYSMQRIAHAHDAAKDMGKMVEKMNLAYVEFVLGRTELCDVQLVGILDYLTYGGYYICGLLVFFMLIWGISCNKLLSGRNHALSRMLYRNGMGAHKQLLCEYVGYFAVTLITALGIAILFGIVASVNSFGIRELMQTDVFVAIGFVFRILPVLVMFTMMHMTFYELLSDNISAVLSQFLIAIGLGYISGCFYPNTFFPQGIQRFAECLPSGAGFSVMRKVMSGLPLENELWIVWAYIAAFALLMLLLRQRRITGDGQ